MGNKHIIPLVAAGNRGKTHTLNLLARHFIQDLNAKILNEVHYTEFDDHIYVLKINSAEKEHIIVVSTQGDDSSHIEKAKSVVDEYLNEADCEYYSVGDLSTDGEVACKRHGKLIH